MSELRNIVSLSKAHITGITEVKPKNYRYPVQLNELKISDNYDIYSKNIENSEGRGVILYISKSLKSREVKMDTNFNEAVWCEVCIKHGEKLLIGCLYRSDSGPSYNNEELNSLITEASQKSCTNLLIMGDFNYKSISWTFSTSLKEDSDEFKFIENLRDNFLVQMVDNYTRYKQGQDPSILDSIITNNDTLVEDLQYDPSIGKSDHLMLTFKIKSYLQDSSSSSERPNYEKGNYTKMSELLHNINWNKLLPDKDVNEQWKIFKNILLSMRYTYIPNRKRRIKSNHFVNPRLAEIIRKKKRSWQRYYETGC